MKLSVITITYNNLSGLKRTLQSVSSQSFRDYEQLVIDGGSTDGTVAFLEQQPSVRWWSEPDKGVYDAQNKGIAHAEGEYCFFLNAGDTLCNDLVLAQMLTQATADVVYGDERVVNEGQQVVGVAKGIAEPTFVDLYNSCMKHQATFIKRSLFAQYGVYDDTLRICADFDWFFRVLAFHPTVSRQYKPVAVSYFENTGLSYHSPELCQTERQLVLDRYCPPLLQADLAFWGRYAGLCRRGKKPLPCWAHKLLRLITRLITKNPTKKNDHLYLTQNTSNL